MAGSERPTTGASILAARAGARVTQQDLAKELGVSQATLIDIENDRLPVEPGLYDVLLSWAEAGLERLAKANETEQAADEAA